MENIMFKDGKHEINYRIQMQLLPQYLRENKEIQAAIYLLALIDSQSAGTAKYIFQFVKKSLPAGFFDNPDINKVARALALRFFDASYLAFEEEWKNYFLEAVSLDMFPILGRGKTDFKNSLFSIIISK